MTHFLGLPADGDLLLERREVATKLLIAEEDKLSHDLEQLEFAESRTARGRDRLNHVRKMRDGFVDGSAERDAAERLFTNVEDIQRLLEGFCDHLRTKVNSRSI